MEALQYCPSLETLHLGSFATFFSEGAVATALRKLPGSAAGLLPPTLRVIHVRKILLKIVASQDWEDVAQVLNLPKFASLDHFTLELKSSPHATPVSEDPEEIICWFRARFEVVKRQEIIDIRFVSE